MQWVFSPFFSSLPEKTEAKIRILQFLCIYPPPTEINEISLSDSLLREKIGVLLIVLLKSVNSDLWQERVYSSLRQPLTKKAIQLLCLDPGRKIWTQGAGYVVKENIRFCSVWSCLHVSSQPARHTCVFWLWEPVLSCHAVPVAQSTAVTGACYRRKHIALVLPHPNDVWEQGREARSLLICLCF